MKLLTSLLLLGLAVVSQAGANQGVISPPLPDLAAGQLKQADAKKLAVAITKAAHPTGKNPDLLNYSDSKKDGVFHLKMHVEYHGAVSKNRYTPMLCCKSVCPRWPTTRWKSSGSTSWTITTKSRPIRKTSRG